MAFLFFANTDIAFFKEPKDCKSNYWLNAIQLEDRAERDAFLEYANKQGVMVRPLWILMNKLPSFKDCQTDALTNSKWLEDRIVNIPSSYIKS